MAQPIYQKIKFLELFFLLCFCISGLNFCWGDLDVVYQWKSVDFEFPNDGIRENYINTGEYVPGTYALPLDVDVWYKGKYLFIIQEIDETNIMSLEFELV